MMLENYMFTDKILQDNEYKQKYIYIYIYFIFLKYSFF